MLHINSFLLHNTHLSDGEIEWEENSEMGKEKG